MNFLALLIGYLIGSLSPAYFLGKILKGIDIRKVGTKNAGATNVKRVLGIGAAAITAILDLSKGLISMLIAYKIGAEPFFIYSAGFFAILGHVFPFYLGFRGGQGVSVSVGLLFFFLVLLFKHHWFPFESLFILAILSASLLFITRTGEIIGLFVLPSFLGFLYLHSPFNLTTGFLGLILVYIFIIELINIYKFHLLQISPQISLQLHHLRTVLRPLAALFIVFYFYWDKKIVLTLIGVIALLFILLDLVRLIHKGTNLFLFKNVVGFFKQKELNKFSSITLFLVACFVTILIFDKEIAATTLIFLIFGDLFAKIFGSIYGKKGFLGKTLEGALSYFAFSVLAGSFLSHFIDIPILTLILGALAATIAESASPFGIDDNFTVALISGSVMYVSKIF